jgi:hypothetical protein
MAYPSSHSGSSFSGSGHATPPTGRSPHCPSASTPLAPAAVPSSAVRTSEGEHQLEKLEFALAVAVTRGDLTRIQCLREQIAALGGNCEEPGT